MALEYFGTSPNQSLGVAWKVDNFLTDALQDVEDRLGEQNLSEPLTTIAKDMFKDVLSVINSGGRGTWSPLSSHTIERHGSHQALRLTDSLYNSIFYRVDQYSARVFSINPVAHLHDSTGRQAGFGAVIKSGKNKGKVGKKVKDKTQSEAAAVGLKTRGWPAMPVRPFMYISEAVAERADDTLLNWLFEEFGFGGKVAA